MIKPSDYAGCLLGGAVGDALGGPIEFHTLQDILRQFGPEGVTGYVELNAQGVAEFTDDTQMTLFTAEGLLCAAAEAGRVDPSALATPLYHAYRRWLLTQQGRYSTGVEPVPAGGFLLQRPELWKRKAPGNTCLSALRSGRMGTTAHPMNDSKGCGAVMRAAPVGLLLRTHRFGSAAFDVGCASGAITHGHPSGYLPAGFLAELIACLASNFSIDESLDTALTLLFEWPNHEETTEAVQRAISAARSSDQSHSPETVERLGAGWVGEEALAIGLYAALAGIQQQSFSYGVQLAINHSGDCDSTGSITGNLLGLVLGVEAIPAEWLERLELRPVIEDLAVNLFVAASNPDRLPDSFRPCSY